MANHGGKTTLEQGLACGAATAQPTAIINPATFDSFRGLTLLAKLAKETVAIAGKPDVKDADRIKALGEALAPMADGKDTAEAKPDHKT